MAEQSEDRMTDQRPEELRQDIARTRSDMDQTLAQIEDRVSPSRIMSGRSIGHAAGWTGHARPSWAPRTTDPVRVSAQARSAIR